jgi:hypothetical protein
MLQGRGKWTSSSHRNKPLRTEKSNAPVLGHEPPKTRTQQSANPIPPERSAGRARTFALPVGRGGAGAIVGRFRTSPSSRKARP